MRGLSLSQWGFVQEGFVLYILYVHYNCAGKSYILIEDTPEGFHADQCNPK